MIATVPEADMAKKKPDSPPDPPPETDSSGDTRSQTVRLAGDIVEMTRAILLARNKGRARRIKIGEFINELLREPLRRIHQKEIAQPPPPPGK